MHHIVEEILAENGRLLTANEQSAVRQRLLQAGNTQEALDLEMNATTGGYNQNRLIEISLGVRVEQLEKLLTANHIPLPPGPDYVYAWAGVSARNGATLYPQLLKALRVLDGQLEASEGRETFYRQLNTSLNLLVSTLQQAYAAQDITLARTRHDKDELKALHEPRTIDSLPLPAPEGVSEQERWELAKIIVDPDLFADTERRLVKVLETKDFVAIYQYLLDRHAICWKDRLSERCILPFIPYLPNRPGKVARSYGHLRDLLRERLLRPKE